MKIITIRRPSAHLDPLVPRAAKPEAIDGDKVRVNSASLDSSLEVLANQALEVLALDKRLRVSGAACRGFSPTSAPWAFPMLVTDRQRSERM
jgi:hypothetical protein